MTNHDQVPRGEQKRGGGRSLDCRVIRSPGAICRGRVSTSHLGWGREDSPAGRPRVAARHGVRSQGGSEVHRPISCSDRTMQTVDYVMPARVAVGGRAARAPVTCSRYCGLAPAAHAGCCSGAGRSMRPVDFHPLTARPPKRAPRQLCQCELRNERSRSAASSMPCPCSRLERLRHPRAATTT